MRLILAAFCCFFLAIASAFAQSDRGTITGTITDPAGAAVEHWLARLENFPGPDGFGESSNARHFCLKDRRVLLWR